MNRARGRRASNRNFVSGGVYDSNASNAEQFQNSAAPEPVTVTIFGKSNEMKVQAKFDESALLADIDVPNLEDEAVRKILLKKIYSNGIRKKQTVRSKERRMRQNRMLRKSLLPKNALMTLNEIKGVQTSDFTTIENPNGGFISSVNVNNIQYEANGISKNGSKNNCCEKAIRDIMLQKLMSLRLSKRQQQLKEAAIADGEKGDVAMKGDNEESMDTGENNTDEELPMLNLASYAIHRLFCQWESEGFDVPDIVNVLGTTSNSGAESQNDVMDSSFQSEKEKTVGANRNELPPNYENMHPATLLCMMRPGVIFETIETIGQTPNITQRVKVMVDDNAFIGVGRSKKCARKDAAINACNEVFGTNFINEIST